MYGIIYKATNLQNQKVYIGQTTQSLAERIYHHYYRADNSPEITHTHFINAIRKYGKNNFEWEIIDRAETKDELDQKERYWIAFFDSINTGYNIQAGGNSYDTEKFAMACGAKPFYAYRVNGEFLGEFVNTKAFGRQFNIADTHVLDILNEKYNSCNGIIAIRKDQFSEELLQEKLKKAKQSFRPFYAKQINTGEVMGPFNSQKECCAYLHFTSNHIGEVLKGQRKSQSGYTFYFADIVD